MIEHPLPAGTACVALTADGLTIARTIAELLPDADVHGLTGRTEGTDVSFGDTGDHLRQLFQAGRPIVAVMAAGILVRILGPILADKEIEPPVLAVAADGGAVVPLLGGHNGANRMARAIAESIGATAAVTTAGDLANGLALDDPPPGWHLEDRATVKPVAAALLAGEPVALDVDAGDAAWITDSGFSFDDTAAKRIVISDRTDMPADAVVLRPPVLALGVGTARGADPAELIDLARATLAEAGLSPGAVACVASVDLKEDEPAVLALADEFGVPARFFSAEELERETPRLANPSEVVFTEVGCHGVSEGAALAAAGGDATLVAEKRKTANATCAIARAPLGIAAHAVGRMRGSLSIVGIGPGNAAWRTPEVTGMLARATDVVGYGLYLDILGELIAGKRRHQSELAQEEARVRASLELAAEGRDVALVSSGDAGIYALATLAFELLDREDRADWNRLDIRVSPGVSALQAAASRIGAPIGHDFCTVSLSDLLTPWPEIERRLKAAAEGDFIVSLYNPVSKRRREQLARARDILLEHRPITTPVILARNLGRPGETVDVITLGELTPDHADMLTLVMIGNRQTRHIIRGRRDWVYTPRGYAAKLDVS